MRRQYLLLCGLVLASGSAAAEQPSSWLDSGKQWVQQLWQNDAQQWLDRINPAVLNYNYKGVMVLVQGNAMETISVDHRMLNGEETLVLRTLSGAPRELIKRGGKVSTDALPGTQANAGLAANQTTFSQFANAIDNKWYKVKLGDKARVAGRAVQQINIVPEDNLRYGYRLWLDVESGLPLKVLTLNERGQTVEQMLFTQIQISPAAKKIAIVKAKPVTLPQSPFKPVKGFRLIAKNSQAASSHYLFSDGLASISLYVEPTKMQEKAQMRKEAVNGLIVANGKTRFVAVGKAPSEILERVLAESGKALSDGN